MIFRSKTKTTVSRSLGDHPSKFSPNRFSGWTERTGKKKVETGGYDGPRDGRLYAKHIFKNYIHDIWFNNSNKQYQTKFSNCIITQTPLACCKTFSPFFSTKNAMYFSIWTLSVWLCRLIHHIREFISLLFIRFLRQNISKTGSNS